MKMVNKWKDYWIFLIAALFMFMLNEGISVFELLLLLFVQLFFVFIPGKIFLISTKLLFKNGAIAHLCAYATGYVLSILLYILLLIIGIQQYCFPIYFVYGIIALFFFYRKRISINYESQIPNLENAILLSCFTASLILCVIVYVLPNRSAQMVGYLNQYGDLTYWFKNCVAATKGYPLPELSIKDLFLYWHLFSCFEVAFLHFTTGIEIYNLCFTFAYIWKMLLLVGGVYVLASYFLKKKRHILIVMLVTLFTSGLDVQTLVYYQLHLYRCSLAFEEGYAMSMFGFVFFLKFMELEKKNVAAYLLTILGTAGALGLKASGGTVLLVGIAARLLFSVKKSCKSIFKSGLFFLSYCFVYLVISKLFMIDGNVLTSSTSSHRMVFSFFNTVMHSGYYQPFYRALKSISINKYVAYVITILIYLIQSNYAVSVPLTIGIFLTIVYGKWRVFLSKDIFSLIAMVVCGVGIFILSSHPGFSQVYFIFNTFSFASVLATLLWEKCEFRLKYVRWISMMTMFVLIILSCYYNFMNAADVYLFSADTFQTRVSAQSSGENDVSDLEMTGLRWIRTNVSEDAVLVTNKVLLDNPEERMFSRTFITSEYSERQVYLEGFSSTNLPNMEFVMDRLLKIRNYYNGVFGSASILSGEGVTHAVVFKGGHDPSIKLEGKVIYENDDIEVLDIRSNL